MSLDGRIAKTDGGVEWLEAVPNPDKLDFGYYDFYETIDVTIMGNSTYSQVMSWGVDWPYPDKTNYVFSRKPGLENTKHVQFISSDHADFVRELKAQNGKDIWLVGGGQLNGFFAREGLLDEIIVHIMPVALGEGIGLFEPAIPDSMLQLIEARSYPNGVQELHYKVA